MIYLAILIFLTVFGFLVWMVQDAYIMYSLVNKGKYSVGMGYFTIVDNEGKLAKQYPDFLDEKKEGNDTNC